MMVGIRDSLRIARLPDGKRLQMRHGPIDLIVEAFGDSCEIEAAYRQAAQAFPDILHELVGELGLLRRPVAGPAPAPRGSIARTMYEAARRHGGGQFVTPMIAVAGAVADHVLGELVRGRELRRAYVNNGGDIALHLSAGEAFDIGVCANPEIRDIGATARIGFDDEVRGVATSGWRGRSHSLGIADAVTVLARDAATADAAATLIANAVALGDHPAVTRAPASSLSPDSDLGVLLVTTAVGALTQGDIRQALSAGRAVAQDFIRRGHAACVYASLCGHGFALSDDDINGNGRRVDAAPLKALEDAHA